MGYVANHNLTPISVFSFAHFLFTLSQFNDTPSFILNHGFAIFSAHRGAFSMTVSIPSSPTFSSSPQPIFSQLPHNSSLDEARGRGKTSKYPCVSPDEIPEPAQVQTSTVVASRSTRSPQPAKPTSAGRQDFWNDPRPTNENPTFVRDYFQASRLHFIGSFRARYESMMVTVGQNLGVNPGLLLQNSQSVSQQASKRSPKERVVLHIDMDAFFASVAVRDDPSLKDLPVAVCHSAGEISSCTYAAREFGVRAGMFLRDARKLCPNLRNVDYDFDAYERVSIQIYSLFFSIPNICVQAVSVDEAYLDLTFLETPSGPSIDTIVSDLRNSIYERTKCTASAGVGPSKLIARLATKAAKPNGQRRILPGQVLSYLNTLSVRDLPGIGWRNAQKLADLDVNTVPQLRALSVQTLRDRFGNKLGTDFHDLACGKDQTKIEPLRPRKSIGAELSWGVRFLNSEADKLSKFIADVCEEVALRVTSAGAYGTKVVYKVYRRIPDKSTKGYKHLGHGPCTIVTRSAKIPSKSAGRNFATALRDVCLQIHTTLKMPADMFRGVGIQVVDLAFADLKFDNVSLADPKIRSIESFFKPGPSTANHDKLGKTQENDNRKRNDQEMVLSTPEGAPEEDRIEPVVGKKCAKSGSNLSKSGKDIGLNPDLNEDLRSSAQVKVGRIEPVLENLETDDINDAIEVDVVNGFQEEADIMIVESVNSKTDAERAVDLTIPQGWDRRVFQELPRDLQDELLKDCHSRDGAGVDARNNGARIRGRIGPSRFSESAGRGLRGAGSSRGRGRGSGVTRGVGRGVRRAENGNAIDRRSKRRKPAQITMTQCAKISKLRKVGTEVLDAEEFRDRPLKECVELLEDLKGRPGLGGCGRGISERIGLSGDQEDSIDGHVGETDIPSPPSLSSDSEIQSDLEEVLERYGREETVIYADEEVWEYASELMRWLEITATDIRSAHVELLRGRLLELLHRKQLQRLSEELQTLARLVQKEACLPWVPLCKKLMEEVQTECLQLFQFRLSMPKVE